MLKRSSPSPCGMMTNASSFMTNIMDWKSTSQEYSDGPLRKKLKRKNVTWASNLTQVRLFRSEDEPRKAGIDLKLALHRAGEAGVASRPLLNGRLQSASQKGKGGRGRTSSRLSPVVIAAAIPQVSWRCPDRFELLEEWSVMAGDASEEVAEQTRRESSALEAVYPRPSSIPDSPAEASEADVGALNDDSVMIIPLVPIDDEEEEIAADAQDSLEEVKQEDETSVSTSGNGGEVAASTISTSSPTVACTPQLPYGIGDDLSRVSDSPSPPLSAASPNPLPLPSLSQPTTSAVLLDSLAKAVVDCTPLPLAASTSQCGQGDVAPDILAASAVVFAALASSNAAQGIDAMLLTQILSHSEVLGREGKSDFSAQDLLAKLAAKLPVSSVTSPATPVSTNPPPLTTSGGLSQHEVSSRLVRAFGGASASPQACALPFQSRTISTVPPPLPPSLPPPSISAVAPPLPPSLPPPAISAVPPPLPPSLPPPRAVAEVRALPPHQRLLPGAPAQPPPRPPFANLPPLPPGPPPQIQTSLRPPVVGDVGARPQVQPSFRPPIVGGVGARPQIQPPFRPPVVGDIRASVRPQQAHVPSDYQRVLPPNVLPNRPPHVRNEQWGPRPPFPLNDNQVRVNFSSVPGPFCRPVGFMQGPQQPSHSWNHEHERFTLANSNQTDGNAMLKNSSRGQKLCSFFNTPQGCRNGVNCTFLHSTTSSQC